MRKNKKINYWILSTSLVFLSQGCSQYPMDNMKSDESEVSFDQAQEFLKQAAADQRQKFRQMSFEAFEQAVFKEPFEGGKYIVNGDTPILNIKLLKEFYQQNVLEEPDPDKELIVHQVDGADALWNSDMKMQLSYCVAQEFGEHYTQVVDDMVTAGGAWEAVAQLDFVHVSDQDQNCNAQNPNVLFDVRPVEVDGQYLARAFFPNEPRSRRNILIDTSSFELAPGRALTLAGILRHEIGHTVGFRHEHTRPDSGTCFEDENWRELTDYDPFSVMHYPHCNGEGDWTLTLTNADESGSACLYGAAAGFMPDPDICTPATPPISGEGIAVTKSFSDQSVAKDAENREGPFKVTPGTVLNVSISAVGDAPGDPDLYVRFSQEPETTGFDCRPYLVGADEQCELDVPQDARVAFVMVRGYAAGHYDLHVEHTPPAQ